MANESTENKKSQKVLFHGMLNNSHTDQPFKISASAAMGVISILVGLVAFVSLMVFFFIKPDMGAVILQFVDKTIIVMAMGSTLLGVRKVSAVLAGKKVDGETLQQLLANNVDLREPTTIVVNNPTTDEKKEPKETEDEDPWSKIIK